jgi:hypothetical protein
MRKLRDIKKKIEKKPRETGEFEGGSKKEKGYKPSCLGTVSCCDSPLHIAFEVAARCDISREDPLLRTIFSPHHHLGRLHNLN